MGFAPHKATPITVDDPADVMFAERTRLNDLANSFRFAWVAGSRQGIIEGDGEQPTDNYIDFRIDLTPGSGYTGYTYRLLCECRTDDPGTSIRPKLLDVTDPDAPAEVVMTGDTTPISAQTWTRKVLTIPVSNMAAGVGYYRVVGLKAGTADSQLIAYLEMAAS